MKKIYHNGLVYTGENELQTAFVEENGKFIFAGDDETALSMAKDGDFIENLEKKFVCAGFNDSHMHLLNYGNVLSIATLANHTKSLEDMLNCMRDFMQNNPVEKGQWLLGRGWNHDYFCDCDRMPNRFDLDQISTEIPICATRVCGHCLVVNSKALEILGISGETPQIPGGLIEMENGEPNGRFFDNAMDQVYDAVPPPSKEKLKNLIKIACKALNSYGVTSSQTDDYANFRTVDWKIINEAYSELEKSGELSVRVCEQANFTNVDDLQKYISTLKNDETGTDMFKLGPLKMLGDGALGARTAFLSKPYADDANTCGLPVFTQEVLDEMISTANKNNLQVCVHCIGDACLDMVLKAYEKALKEFPRKNHRNGIVHCQITRPDQLEKIAELKLHIYAQSIFLDYDINIVEERVGKELASSSYSWKTLMKKGVRVSNGSDCPVEWPNCLGSIQCAVTRQSLKGGKIYLPDEAFSVKEALDSYTIHAAAASFDENIKGKIQEGMLADFVILEKNPFEIPAEEINNIKILRTYLGGKLVFENKN